MNHTITVHPEQLEPIRAEKILYEVLTVLFLLPLAIFRYILILLLNWLVYRLLSSVIRTYASLPLPSDNQEAIKSVHSNLTRLNEPLQNFYKALCYLKTRRIYFISNRVKRVAELIENYNDLLLAYQIFMEPVTRNYPVSKEFENLRYGRQFLSVSKNISANSANRKDEFSGQIVFPTPL
jgi:hypothetical protein